MFYNNEEQESGFTIIEVMIVVAIIGIISRLAAVLANTGLMNLPDKGYMVNDIVRKFSSIVVCFLLLIGVVIFMIIQPGIGPVLSKFEIDYS